MQEKKWLDWLIRLQSLAQAGLAYGKDKYDIERFEEIRAISVQMMTDLSDLPAQKVKHLFADETGYQTPKIDTRAAIFKDDKILLVQEANGDWALPGGWCDVDQSVRENTIKEVKEEAGLDVVLDKVIAIQDRDKHNQPPYAYKICKIFSLCHATGGTFTNNLETIASDYFELDKLPRLAQTKTNEEQVQMCFLAHKSNNWKTLVD
ncbi:NUDIX hydrolase N-terminal domain-containing protein [Streptococcus orisasini]